MIRAADRAVLNDALDFSTSYMRDEYTEEACLFMNHLSSIMAFQISDEIYSKDKTKDVSLEDFISILSKINADRVDKKWRCAKISKERADFTQTFGLDISASLFLQKRRAASVTTGHGRSASVKPK